MSGVDEASKKPVACSDYNPIFERLFGDVEDGSANVEGLVAYGLYKISKREWVTGLRKKEARGPSAEELRAYMATWTTISTRLCPPIGRTDLGELRKGCPR
jgi:hypothetical protein